MFFYVMKESQGGRRVFTERKKKPYLEKSFFLCQKEKQE